MQFVIAHLWCGIGRTVFSGPVSPMLSRYGFWTLLVNAREFIQVGKRAQKTYAAAQNELDAVGHLGVEVSPISPTAVG